MLLVNLLSALNFVNVFKKSLENKKNVKNVKKRDQNKKREKLFLHLWLPILQSISIFTLGSDPALSPATVAPHHLVHSRWIRTNNSLTVADWFYLSGTMAPPALCAYYRCNAARTK